MELLCKGWARLQHCTILIAFLMNKLSPAPASLPAQQAELVSRPLSSWQRCPTASRPWSWATRQQLYRMSESGRPESWRPGQDTGTKETRRHCSGRLAPRPCSKCATSAASRHSPVSHGSSPLSPPSGSHRRLHDSPATATSHRKGWALKVAWTGH